MLLAFYVSHHVYKKPQRWWFEPFCCCRGFLFSFNIFEVDYLKAFWEDSLRLFPIRFRKKTLRNNIHKSTTNSKNNLVKFYPHRSLIRFQTSVLLLWCWCWILIWTIMILLFSAIFLKDIVLYCAVFVFSWIYNTGWFLFVRKLVCCLHYI